MGHGPHRVPVGRASVPSVRRGVSPGLASGVQGTEGRHQAEPRRPCRPCPGHRSGPPSPICSTDGLGWSLHRGTCPDGQARPRAASAVSPSLLFFPTDAHTALSLRPSRVWGDEASPMGGHLGVGPGREEPSTVAAASLAPCQMPPLLPPLAELELLGPDPRPFLPHHPNAATP